MSEARLHVSAVAQEFLAALDDIPDEEWVRPPGLGGPYRAKHVRQGLKTGAIIIHVSGKGLVWTLTTSAATLQRIIEADDRFPPAAPDAVAKLLATFRRMEFGLVPKPETKVAAAADPWSLD